MKTVLSIVHQDREFSSGDYQQTKLEVIAKYRQELAAASWWRRYLLYLKIERETRRILSNRLYLNKWENFSQT